MWCRSRRTALSNTSAMPVKPWLGQQRAVKPALRGAARVHALHHGAVLRRHQAGGLGAGDAERVHGGAAVSRSPRAAPAAAENTPTVAPECQPWPICSWPMHSPTRGPIS